jgi:hypothetical protein
MKGYFVLAATLGLTACANLTPQQQANLQLELSVAKQIGNDAAQVWCMSSGVIFVIAKDVNSQGRITTALGKNSSAATDACPMLARITGNPQIQVVTQTQATAVAVVAGGGN